jgi:hypothetical protein
LLIMIEAFSEAFSSWTVCEPGPLPTLQPDGKSKPNLPPKTQVSEVSAGSGSGSAWAIGVRPDHNSSTNPVIRACR